MKIYAKGVSLAMDGRKEKKKGKGRKGKERKKIGLGEGEEDRRRSVEGLMVEGRAFTRGIS